MDGKFLNPMTMGIDRFQKRAVKVLKPPGGDCHDIFGGDYDKEVDHIKPPVPHCSSVSSEDMEQKLELEKILKPPGGGSSDIFGTTSAQENSARAAEYKIKNAGNDTSSRIFGLLESNETPRKVKNYLKSSIFEESDSAQQQVAVEQIVEQVVEEINESEVCCKVDDESTCTENDNESISEIVPDGEGGDGDGDDVDDDDGENSSAVSATKRSGLGNPITGEGYKSEDIETEKCIRHPQVRVRNPPGGPSTKLW